jgi:group I intron endonuclease
MGYIYKIINKVNGMIYVGQTTQILEERWKQHLKITSNCRYMKSAFKKYGIDQFEFKMICICFDEELDKFEIQYIKLCNSMVPNGYNLRSGGSSGRHHEETKKKISDTLKNRKNIFEIIRPKPQLGKPHTEETKQKISNALKGRTDIIRIKPSHWIGKTHTEESKNKMRNSHKGTSINQFDLNNHFIKHFSSISEASNETNLDRSHIRRCCKYIHKTAGGFKWKYE